MLTEYAKWWNLELKIPDTKILKEAMKKGEAWAVSNGSFVQGAGAAAWTIEGQNKEGRCTGTSLAPGVKSDQSAFRTELAGIYNIVYTLQYMTATWEDKELHLKIACNGKSAVDRLNSQKRTKLTEAHYNILAAIQKYPCQTQDKD